jgi:hypothetical protein
VRLGRIDMDGIGPPGIKATNANLFARELGTALRDDVALNQNASRMEDDDRYLRSLLHGSRYDPPGFRKSLELPVLIEEFKENVSAAGLKIDERKTEA